VVKKQRRGESSNTLLAALPFISFEILLLMYLMGHIHSFVVANIPFFIVDLILFVGACVLSCALN
jgi:hypothetical protein